MKTNHYKAKNALTYIRPIVHTMTWEIPEVHSKQVTFYFYSGFHILHFAFPYILCL